MSSKQKMKPRFVTLEANFKDGSYPDSVTFNKETGILEFENNGELLTPKTANVEWAYARQKKEKPIRKYPIDEENIQLHPDYSLMQADTIYVIDTNTDTKNKISVSCILQGTPRLDENGEKIGIHFKSLPYLVVKGNIESPEKAGWCQLIKREVNEPGINILIIVDAYLDELELYNSGERPVLGEFYLPRNVNLMYASADVGKEHIVNKVMSQADKAATKMTKQILSGEVCV